MAAAQKKHLFAQITKVNVATRSVKGIAMQEVVDASNEMCLYEESKPYFQKWSATQHKNSGGKSRGNVRVMHTAKVAGIVTELVCNDAEKAFEIDTEIVDDGEWALVMKGAYTGFSIGANFAKDSKGKRRVSVNKDGVTEWVAVPVEVSLVDIPCVPTAVFTEVGEDGTEKVRKFHVGEAEKSMYHVSGMASNLMDLSYLIRSLDYEAEEEGDDSVIPDRLREWLQEGAEIFGDLAAEETSEFVAQFQAAKTARAEQMKAAGKCNCDCTNCADCTVKKAAQTAKDDEPMTPEQIKAATTDSLKAIFGSDEYKSGQAAIVKGVLTSDEGKAAIGEVIKAELPAQIKTAVDTAIEPLQTKLTAMEEQAEGFKELMEAIGNMPGESAVKHQAAHTVTREQDKGAEGGEDTFDASKLKVNDTSDVLKALKHDAQVMAGTR